MSCQKPRSRKVDTENNMIIVDFFPQVPRKQQNGTHRPQKKAESRKWLRDITSTQGQESYLPKKIPEDKTTHSKKIYITLDKNDHMKYELSYSERAVESGTTTPLLPPCLSLLWAHDAPAYINHNPLLLMSHTRT